MVLYDGELPPGFTADCMENQLHFMDAVVPLFRPDLLFGNTCDIVDGGPAARCVWPDYINPTMFLLFADTLHLQRCWTSRGHSAQCLPSLRALVFGPQPPPLRAPVLLGRRSQAAFCCPALLFSQPLLLCNFEALGRIVQTTLQDTRVHGTRSSRFKKRLILNSTATSSPEIVLNYSG